MKLKTNWQKLLKFFIYIISFTSAVSLSYAQTVNPNIRIEYKNNLLNLSARKADLKNVLLMLSDKTGISVRFPDSLKQQISIKISAHSIKEALSRILKGLNYAIIYSGSGKHRAVVSKILVYQESKRSKISNRSIHRRKQITGRIRYYERRLGFLKNKLSQADKNSRQGKQYLRQIRSYENIIKNLKKKIR